MGWQGYKTREGVGWEEGKKSKTLVLVICCGVRILSKTRTQMKFMNSS